MATRDVVIRNTLYQSALYGQEMGMKQNNIKNVLFAAASKRSAVLSLFTKQTLSG